MRPGDRSSGGAGGHRGRTPPSLAAAALALLAAPWASCAGPRFAVAADAGAVAIAPAAAFLQGQSLSARSAEAAGSDDDDGYASVARAAMRAPLPEGSESQISDQVLQKVVAARVREAQAQHRVMKEFMRRFARNLKLSVLEDSKGDMPEAKRLAAIAEIRAEALADGDTSGGGMEKLEQPRPPPQPRAQRRPPLQRRRVRMLNAEAPPRATEESSETLGHADDFRASIGTLLLGAGAEVALLARRRYASQHDAEGDSAADDVESADTERPEEGADDEDDGGVEEMQRSEGDGVWHDDTAWARRQHANQRPAQRGGPRLLFADPHLDGRDGLSVRSDSRRHADGGRGAAVAALALAVAMLPVPHE